VEPVLWLIAPLVVTVVVAALLLWRDRAPNPADAQELQREKLARIEQVLRPDEQSDPR
jgi:cytochrome c-type biogenesis protein CcmH/NrfF